MKKTIGILGLFVALIVFVACDGAEIHTNPSSEFVTYRASDGAFSVEHPSNWKGREFDASALGAPPAAGIKPEDARGVIFSQKEPSSGSSVVVSLFGGEFVQSELRLGVVIFGSGLSFGDSPQESAEFFRSSNEEGSQRVKDYERVTFAATTIDGEPAWDYTFRFVGAKPDGGTAKTTSRQIFLRIGGRDAMIVVGAFTSTFDEQASVIDRFVSSFRIG